MGFFQDLFTGGSDAYRNAGKTVALGYQQGYDEANPQYQQAKTDISSGFGQAQDVWRPVYNTGQAGANFYADITGANGPEGQARARATFQTDPGYQFAVSEALRATERQGGTGGFQNSSNVLDALQSRASGLAQQQYGNWVSRVAPFLGYSLGGAAGLGSAYTGEGTQLAGVDKALGDLAYQTKTGGASALAAGELGASKAQAAASTNLFNKGVDLAGKLLGYAMPTGGGLPGGGSGNPFYVNQQGGFPAFLTV